VTVINEFPKIFTSFIIGSLIEVFVHPIRMVFKFEHKAYKNESKKCSEDREKNKMGKGG
jgi:hypothetical protein